MKKIGLILFVAIMAAIPVPAEKENTGTPSNRFFVLDNGLGVFLQKRDHIPLVNIVFALNLGSKDEDQKTNGLVHLLEHLLLLGPTKLHTADEINLEMRRYGCQFNAHTSHDSMTFELSLPAQYWEFGLSLLEEKLFRFHFSQQQADKEKEIIFEEISQYRDDPFSLGTHLVLQLLFAEHPYHFPVFGDPQVIKKATIEEVVDFSRRFMVPSNCSLVVVGDVDLDQAYAKVRQIFANPGGIKESEAPPLMGGGRRPPIKPVMDLKKNLAITQTLDIQEARLILGFIAPSLDHPDRLSLDLLRTILGRGINPLLNSALNIGGKPLVNYIDIRYVGLDYGGAVLIYFTLDPKNIKTVQRESMNFLKSLWRFNFSIDDYPWDQRMGIIDYLETAKNEIKFFYQQSQEQGLNAAISYARYFLLYKDNIDQDQNKQEPFLVRVEKIKSSNLRDAASRYLSGEKYVMVTLLPGNKEADKEKKGGE